MQIQIGVDLIILCYSILKVVYFLDISFYLWQVNEMI